MILLILYKTVLQHEVLRETTHYDGIIGVTLELFNISETTLQQPSQCDNHQYPICVCCGSCRSLSTALIVSAQDMGQF